LFGLSTDRRPGACRRAGGVTGARWSGSLTGTALSIPVPLPATVAIPSTVASTSTITVSVSTSAAVSIPTAVSIAVVRKGGLHANLYVLRSHGEANGNNRQHHACGNAHCSSPEPGFRAGHDHSLI
jgi:hypothetical protein